MNTSQAETDKLAAYRAAVAAEDESKTGMSDKTAERLRQTTYEDRLNKQAEEKFACGLAQIEPTRENLGELISRCSGAPSTERNVLKLLFWIQSRGWRLGHEIRRPEGIAFISELTPEEVLLSEATFIAKWKVKKIVPPKQDGPEVRYCTLKRKCLRFKNGKPGVLLGTGDFCSTDCRGRAKWQKKGSGTIATARTSQIGALAPA